MRFPRYKRIASYYAEHATVAAFKNRRGHGGGEITRRVLRPAELEAIIIAACRATADEVVRYERGAPDMVRESKPGPDGF